VFLSPKEVLMKSDFEQKNEFQHSPLWNHFADLKASLFRIFLVFLILGALIWHQLPNLSKFIYYPYYRATDLFNLPQADKLIATNVFDVISINLKLSMFLTFYLILPYCLWEIWRFLSPGLYDYEKSLFKSILISALGCFYLGLCLCYFLILPFLLKQALHWTLKFASPFFSLSSYLRVLMGSCLAFGLIFQIPVLLGTASYFGWIQSQSLKKNRKWILLLSLVLSAVIGPPDVMSQITLSAPIFLLFESSFWLMDLLAKKKAAFIAKIDAEAQSVSQKTKEHSLERF
jgi:sec-independent protein translocase protein TatC